MSVMNERANVAILIERCIAGDQAAWHALFQEYHPRLLATISRRLGERAEDPYLVDEVAAAVWRCLIEKDRRRLRLYDPCRAGLSTFLGCLVREQIYHIDHGRKRKSVPEVPLPEDEEPADRCTLARLCGPFWDEFLWTLSERERLFLDVHLIGNGEEALLPGLTAVNFRKLKQRVLAKCNAFFRSE